MKIIVVADTHKDYKKYKAIVEKNIDADLFIHLGDGEHEFADVKNEFPEKNFIFVQGNCDFGSYKLLEVVEAQGYRILCVHGHEYNVQGGLDALISEAKAHNCTIALYGHTHMAHDEYIPADPGKHDSKPLWILSPGSVSKPRDSMLPSFGILDLTEKGVLFSVGRWSASSNETARS